jgi:hypothetical protein
MGRVFLLCAAGQPVWEKEQVASLRGMRLAPVLGGLLVGLAPDDSPLVLRDVGSQEIYALDLELP